MKRTLPWILVVTAGSCAVLLFARYAETQAAPQGSTSLYDHQVEQNRAQMFDQGKHIFRYDTFGDEAFWGGTLRLHQAIAGEKNGGVGPGVSPKIALSVGLKVDADALPAELVLQIKAGKVNLDDPATTLALLKLNAVVGVTARFDSQGKCWKLSLAQRRICGFV